MPLPSLRNPFVRAALICAAVAGPARTVADPAPAQRLAICFAPGTPLVVQRERKAAVALYQADENARWSRTATDGSSLRRGEPMTLTWSVVPDGTPIPGYVGEASATSDLRTWLTIKYGGESQWLPIFKSVFARWSQLSGITYVHELADDASTLGNARGVTGVRADIRIGGHRIDGNNGTLGYNFFPDDGDMVLDTSDHYFDTVANDSRRLRNVVAHENGHGLGMDHVCPVDGTKLMEPTTATSIDGPQLDDILAAQRLYGDRFEDDETTAEAAELGALRPGDTIVDDVSIDGADDVDVYAFTALEGARVDIVLVPVGATYGQGPQNTDGSCGDGTTFDALRRVDLSLELLGPDGRRRLAVADGARTGATEEVVGIALAGTQPHFIRVTGDRDDVQLYRLVVTVIDPADRPTAADDVATTQAAVPTRMDVLANDTGVTATAVSVAVATQPAGGTARATGGGIVRYAPGRGFAGTDVFTYRVRDAAGRASVAAVRVTVESALYAGDARFDDDADLYPDELETRLGTSSADSSSRPAGGPPAVFAPTHAKALLRFRKDRRDALLLRGALPLLPGTALRGADVVVYTGGQVRRFTLDRKGRAKDDGGSLRIGAAGASPAAFRLRLRGVRLADDWADEGLLDEEGVVKEYRELTVFLIVGDQAFTATLPLRYTVRRGKGKPKLLRD